MQASLKSSNTEGQRHQGKDQTREATSWPKCQGNQEFLLQHFGGEWEAGRLERKANFSWGREEWFSAPYYLTFNCHPPSRTMSIYCRQQYLSCFQTRPPCCLSVSGEGVTVCLVTNGRAVFRQMPSTGSHSVLSPFYTLLSFSPPSLHHSPPPTDRGSEDTAVGCD